MNLFFIIGIAVSLAMDALAVAVVTSITMAPVSRRQIFRFSFHFGLFQALMPVIGWMVGHSIVGYIAEWDHWLAFGLLFFIGSRMIYGSLRGEEGESDQIDPTRGFKLVFLSVATSIDALAVGLSFSFLKVDIIYPALIIGVITSGLTLLGMLVGNRIGLKYSKGMEIIGGLILIGIGINIVISHIF